MMARALLVATFFHDRSHDQENLGVSSLSVELISAIKTCK